VKKYGTAKQATDNNMAHALHVLDNTHIHTHKIYNTYCFSMMTMVTLTQLNVMPHVFCTSLFEVQL